jgi:predicted nucleic acid-binding protein
VKAYLDASLVLAYFLGGNRELERIPKDRVVGSSRLLWIEVRRTLERAYRENHLDAEDGVRVGRGFDRAARGITRLRLDERVMRRAEASFPVLIRTLDALHLATALVWSGDEPLEETEIWTLDRQMSLCAGALGFVTPLFGR